MQVSRFQPGARISAPRGSSVVCIQVCAGEFFAGCLRSVLAHTPRTVPILVCDSAAPDSCSLDTMTALEGESASGHELFYARWDCHVGPGANANCVFALTAPADVVVLSSDCVVADGWLDGLRQAAYMDSTVATSTALSSDVSVLPVAREEFAGLPPEEGSIDDAAAAVRSHSLRLRPRLPSAGRHCMYVRRTALELVGGFDPAFAPVGGDEIRFSERCVRSGLSHVLADDVLVLHRARGTAADSSPWAVARAEREHTSTDRCQKQHTRSESRQTSLGPLTRSISCARRALTGLSVVIDARILSRTTTGTEIQVLEVIAALARTEKAHLTAIVPGTLAQHAARRLASLPNISLVHHSEAVAATGGSANIVHRPYQINDPGDLTFLASLGERLIVTNQDLIAYRNPSYFEDFEAWDGYRRLTQLTLGVVDRVVFFSAHARDDALSEDLVDPSRASVVAIGVDHAIAHPHGRPVAPAGARGLPETAEAMLCIGNDFRHKNRVFALRMLEELQRRHDWTGHLLFAGPSVRHGSSSTEEAELLALHPRLADFMIDFGAVSDAEKAWLLGRTGLVVYPTTYEGFGLVPFEAAHHGVPCMWAAVTSLREVLPDSAAEIKAWDAAHSADRAIELLRDENARERNLAAIRTAGAKFSWESTASRLLELYGIACDAPALPISARPGSHGVSYGALSEDAMRLVGPGGALPADVERPLLALATHPQFGAPVFGALKLGYSASRKMGQRRARTAGGPGS
jgi:glycosyltransferase involved in cell wall biosynthesis